MLPNPRPLVVADQFSVLESLYPGRIDVGLGRSVGSPMGAPRARAWQARCGGLRQQLTEVLEFFGRGGEGVHVAVAHRATSAPSSPGGLALCR